MSRGNGKMAIYCDDIDRCRFLAVLERMVEQYSVECHAYCLMSNHYHLVLRTLEANLSRAIQYLNGVYAQWWNRRHTRVGHVLQGRFKAQLIERDGYFLEVCRYVVLNPVRAGLVSNVLDWPWTSYAATAGVGPRPVLLTTDLLLGSRAGGAACQAYRAFIAAGGLESAVTAAIRSDIPVVGTEAFVARYRPEIELAHATEVPRRQRQPGRPTLEALFAGVNDKKLRNVRIREARARFQYTLTEIASHIDLHYCTVSRIASNLASSVGSPS
jgi:putative transposase